LRFNFLIVTGLDSTLFFIGSFYSKKYVDENIQKFIEKDNEKDQFIEFNFFKIYLKIHYDFCNKTYFEIFYFRKKKYTHIKYLKNCLLTATNFSTFQQNENNTEITNYHPIKKTFTGIKKDISNNRAYPKKYLSLKNNFPKDIRNKIQKDYKFSHIRNTNIN